MIVGPPLKSFFCLPDIYKHCFVLFLTLQIQTCIFVLPMHRLNNVYLKQMYLYLKCFKMYEWYKQVVEVEVTIHFERDKTMKKECLYCALKNVDCLWCDLFPNFVSPFSYVLGQGLPLGDGLISPLQVTFDRVINLNLCFPWRIFPQLSW